MVPSVESKAAESAPVEPPPANHCVLEFDAFWEAYPRKESIFEAQRAFVEAGAKAAMPEILAALAWQVKSDQWKEEGGKYIPKPAKYLMEGQWKNGKRAPKRNGPNINELDHE